MNNSRFLTAVSIVLVGAFMRFLPHAPNFVPVAAMALFGGAYLGKKTQACGFVLLIMLLSDLILGFHSTMIFVYGALALGVFFGSTLSEGFSVPRLAGTTLLSSVCFFLITNFGTFVMQDLYPRTAAGLLLCYTAAIPFFYTSLMADLLFVSVFFGAYAFFEKAVLPRAAA